MREEPHRTLEYPTGLSEVSAKAWWKLKFLYHHGLGYTKLTKLTQTSVSCPKVKLSQEPS